MKVNLAYGKTGYIIELPDTLNVDIIEPLWVECVKDQGHAITEALRNPCNSKPLMDIVGKDDKIAVIFSDITRATPYDVILPALLNELKDIPRENIIFFCATGTHRPATIEELNRILGKSAAEGYKIVQNDTNNPELHEYVGTTTSGNRIIINKELLSCKIKILTVFIEPHFFAGFSGGGKAMIPGMAFAETIKYNHSIVNLSERNAVWGITEGNPIWEEIMEAARFVPGVFLLNITLNKNKEITGVFAGDLTEAHRAGCRFAKESAMVPVNKLYDIVITTNSGYPLDLNIYQTVKGMSAAAQIVKKGGTIIMAAECWDGIPSASDYARILKTVGNVNNLMPFVKENERRLKDTWQIYLQALIQQKADVYMFSDKLDDETIKEALFKPVSNIAALVAELVNKTGPQAEICILPEGPQTIPYYK